MKLKKYNKDIEIIGFRDIKTIGFMCYSSVLLFKYMGEEDEIMFFSDLKHPNDYSKDEIIKLLERRLADTKSDVLITSRDDL